LSNKAKEAHRWLNGEQNKSNDQRNTDSKIYALSCLLRSHLLAVVVDIRTVIRQNLGKKLGDHCVSPSCGLSQHALGFDEFCQLEDKGEGHRGSEATPPPETGEGDAGDPKRHAI
jgi:hypothetical protein